MSPPMSGSGRLQQTGASIMGGSRAGSERGSRPPSEAGYQGQHAHQASVPYMPQMPGMPQTPGGCSESSLPVSEDGAPAAPPSVSRTGRLYTDNVPTVDPYMEPTQNIPTLRKAMPFRTPGPPEGLPKAVWSDSVLHLGEDPWPHHAVPLFVFSGRDRPRPAYREEIRFTLKDDRYVSFGLRLRCGTGDRYMGGTIGLIHNPMRQEAMPGDEGQLATVIDIVVQPDNTVIVSAIGDLDFQVKQSWMPRGLRGLQLAFVDVERAKEKDEMPMLQTCLDEPGFGLFGRLVQEGGPPGLAEALSGSDGPFTAFIPTDAVLMEALGGGSIEDMLKVPYLQAVLACHICKGKVTFEAMYSGRTLQAVDGSVVVVTFKQWPRGSPHVNEIPAVHMDINCSNGVVHSLAGVMTPAPRPIKRGR
eukprot:TRINITY_DN80682_c0_g1_i1.p1 TRINITY_DN80682_c0_g1~~TRINITY_DN80682_c0_g1_i1.p1  ORF type:complete len:416 (+),score=76.46 TRINITY_DN80682_c0_g1_i1:87-1334(+)